MKLGERLRQLRKKKGWSQGKLSEKLDLTQKTISHYESLKRTPDYTILLEIARIFDVSVDYLLGNTDIPTPPHGEQFDPHDEDWLDKAPQWMKEMWNDKDYRRYLENPEIREVLLDPINQPLFRDDSTASAKKDVRIDILDFIAWRLQKEGTGVQGQDDSGSRGT